jgi:hypothetical protein
MCVTDLFSPSGRTDTIPYVVIRANRARTKIRLPLQLVAVISASGPENRRVTRSYHVDDPTMDRVVAARDHGVGESTRGASTNRRWCTA